MAQIMERLRVGGRLRNKEDIKPSTNSFAGTVFENTSIGALSQTDEEKVGIPAPEIVKNDNTSRGIPGEFRGHIWTHPR